MRWRAIVLILLGAGVLPGHAAGDEPIAYVTEIQDLGKGAAVVHRPGDDTTVAVQPFTGLRQGDEVRITGDTRLVILYHVGSGTRTLTRADSPFRVVSAPAARSGDRLRVLVAAIGAPRLWVPSPSCSHWPRSETWPQTQNVSCGATTSVTPVNCGWAGGWWQGGVTYGVQSPRTRVSPYGFLPSTASRGRDQRYEVTSPQSTAKFRFSVSSTASVPPRPTGIPANDSSSRGSRRTKLTTPATASAP